MATSAQRQPAGGREHDVLVVGAGISGLVAARQVVQADPALSVIVLEAPDHVGGRTLNAPLPGGKSVEVGAQWVGPGQTEILALAEELGIATFAIHDEGARILETQDRLLRYEGEIPTLETDVLVDFATTAQALNAMAQTVPADAPWTAARAEEWDAQTLASWLDGEMKTAEGRALMDLDRGRLVLRPSRRVAAPSARLHPRRRELRGARRDARWSAAGPLRGRLPAGLAPDRRGARRACRAAHACPSPHAEILAALAADTPAREAAEVPA